MTESAYPFINREISWLHFNERVLREAEDPDVPLLERLKFLAIFSNNLDEFFMIRVAGVKDQIGAGYTKKDRSGMTPTELMDRIAPLAHRLIADEERIFRRLKQDCRDKGILITPPITGDLEEIAEAIFDEEILPLLAPVTLSPANPSPFISNLRMTVFVTLERGGTTRHSLITFPENLQRVFRVRLDRVYFLTVEQIIRHHLDRIFTGFTVVDSHVIRVTRNADLSVEEEGAEDLLGLIKKKLSAREKGKITRVEIDKEPSPSQLKILESIVPHDRKDRYVINGTVDLTFLFSLCGEQASLCYTPFTPCIPPGIPTDAGLFDRIKKQDIVLYRPFHDFSLVSRLVALAADDTDVLAIKMTLYRTNDGSSIIESLARAARAGKQVAVVIELKARFDEERNVEWASTLETAGCIVTYGFVDLKIHAKNLLVVRRESGGIVRYVHLSTGNYNEKTASLYTDIDYLTADEATGEDTANLFNYLTGYTDYVDWKRFTLAPKDLRDSLVSLIDTEIDNARAGRGSGIVIKVNSLIDRQLIQKLYEASMAGVPITAIVRGICGLMPGIPGLSETISVRSIIGRLLEHPRILVFHADGKRRTFISTADWMERNMDRRVELSYEIIDENAKAVIGRIIDENLADDRKAWELVGDTYRKCEPADTPYDSQRAMIGDRLSRCD